MTLELFELYRAAEDALADSDYHTAARLFSQAADIADAPELERTLLERAYLAALLTDRTR